MLIYIDIETIPSQRPEAKLAAAAKVHHPTQMTKAETIAKWDEEKRPAAEKEQWKKTALNGGWGEIACICWAVGDGPIEQATRPTVEDSEALCLSSFFLGVELAQKDHNGRPVHWVGHNLCGFDLRFLWQRAIVLGVNPGSVNLRQDDTSWKGTVIDTMAMWAGARGSVKLTELCDILSIDVGHEDTIDGSQVWDTYRAGDFATVLEHCRADVERTRAVHRRMRFME